MALSRKSLLQLHYVFMFSFIQLLNLWALFDNNFYYCRDEHSLIAQYCQKLHNGDINSLVPDSPLQLMAELDSEKRHQLEMMIRYVISIWYVLYAFTSIS